MGLNLILSGNSISGRSSQKKYKVVRDYTGPSSRVRNPNNPDPKNFNIERLSGVGKFWIAEVNYPNCTNYEGRKILLFDKMFEGKPLTRRKILYLKTLDPHFSENKKYLSPIARFEPTIRGWRMAAILAKTLSKV